MNEAHVVERVRCTVDIEKDGKHHGYLNIPHSRDDSAWGAVRVPVSVIRNGAGPTVLFTGGNHGDEYEGPIALQKLARRLEPEQVRGCVIIMPALNAPAVLAGTRTSPIDGANMNRIFPGDRRGGVSAMIADYVTRHFITRAQTVVDIHSGGKTLDFVPFAAIHDLENCDQMTRCREVMAAFDAPVSLVLDELDSEGMLDTTVEDMGKTFLSTELGGGGFARLETVRIADQGVENVLRHLGIVEGKPVSRKELGLEPARFLTMNDDATHISDDNGLFEPLFELGDAVEKGQPLARVFDPMRTDLEPAVYTANTSGIAIQRHFPGLVKTGDCLAIVGQES